MNFLAFLSHLCEFRVSCLGLILRAPTSTRNWTNLSLTFLSPFMFRQILFKTLILAIMFLSVFGAKRICLNVPFEAVDLAVEF